MLAIDLKHVSKNPGAYFTIYIPRVDSRNVKAIFVGKSPLTRLPGTQSYKNYIFNRAAILNIYLLAHARFHHDSKCFPLSHRYSLSLFHRTNSLRRGREITDCHLDVPYYAGIEESERS